MITLKNDIWTFQPSQTLLATGPAIIKKCYWHRRRQTWSCLLVSTTLGGKVRQLETELARLFLQFPSESLGQISQVAYPLAIPDPIRYQKYLQLTDLENIWKSRSSPDRLWVDFPDPEPLGLYQIPHKRPRDGLPDRQVFVTVQLTSLLLGHGVCQPRLELIRCSI